MIVTPFPRNAPTRRVMDVTVVMLDDGPSSTSVMPIEIFHSAGKIGRAHV